MRGQVWQHELRIVFGASPEAMSHVEELSTHLLHRCCDQCVIHSKQRRFKVEERNNLSAKLSIYLCPRCSSAESVFPSYVSILHHVCVGVAAKGGKCTIRQLVVHVVVGFAQGGFGVSIDWLHQGTHSVEEEVGRTCWGSGCCFLITERHKGVRHSESFVFITARSLAQQESLPRCRRATRGDAVGCTL